MNIKLTSLLSAVALALVATTSSSFAKTYTTATFKKELKAKLAKKTGAGAYNTAANFLKQALTDPKNKKLVASFTSSTVAALKKPVATPLKVKSASAIAKALTTGYFTKLTYDPTDKNFAKSLQTAVKSITDKAQKTSATGKSLFTTVYAVKKTANTAAFQNFLNQTIYTALGLKEWPIIS